MHGVLVSVLAIVYTRILVSDRIGACPYRPFSKIIEDGPTCYYDKLTKITKEIDSKTTDQVTVDLNCFLMCLLTHQSLSLSK